MRSLLMTEAYNNAEELRTSMEADLQIMEAFEKLMELEEQVAEKMEKKEKRQLLSICIIEKQRRLIC